MTDIYSVFFSFQKQEEIQQIDRLNPIIQQIVSCGYYLVAEEEQQDIYSKLSNWIIQLHHQSEQDQVPAIPVQPGISDPARQHVEQFCQEGTEQCDLIGFWAADSGSGRGFDFRLTHGPFPSSVQKSQKVYHGRDKSDPTSRRLWNLTTEPGSRLRFNRGRSCTTGAINRAPPYRQ